MARMTKSEIVNHISKVTGVNRKDVKAVFLSLGKLAKAQLGKRGPGEFAILPGMVKARVRTKPAIPAGKWFNPFTKTEEVRKGKPARRVVRLTALKALKEVL